MNTPYFFRITVLISILLLNYPLGFSQQVGENTSFYESYQLTEANLIPQISQKGNTSSEGSLVKYEFTPIHLKEKENKALSSFAIRAGEGEDFHYRYQMADLSWSSWIPLAHFHDKNPFDRAFVSELVFLPEEVEAIQLREQTKATTYKPKILLDIFSPDKAPAAKLQRMADEGPCDCAIPEYVDIIGWGSHDGLDPSCPDIAYVPVTHMIVHHTVNSNAITNWQAAVFSIWNFHVNTNNWCDLGYNWLIDPNGVLYEGRGGGDNVRGAHFCGRNGGTMGIAMLGTFSDVPPTEAALTTLKGILAWKSCKSNINPLSNSLHTTSNLVLAHISGHRDGCSTLCPGDSLYNKLGGIRQDVEDIIMECLLTTDLDVEESDQGLSLSPNPFANTLRITLSQEVKISSLIIRDIQGKRLWTSSSTPQKQITLSTDNWPRGIYFIEAVGDSFSEFKKVIKL
ncbi:MAG: N-acetylmuramoyl-L-alanine amidase [Bacteroidota bacterium]